MKHGIDTEMFNNDECIIIDNEGRAWFNKVVANGTVRSSYMGQVDIGNLKRLAERLGLPLRETSPRRRNPRQHAFAS
jgi:hypothetical protein